ncbi:460eccdf-58ac-4672-b086-95b556afbbb7-CDS [Sclerotinia trifoliorum]|uniref:460eccdf-58ac-4672-b086-95b556afbbb7-CDS n=1 Tax=Sclerotinia trifoliorum TaxID=28548 RepID=A0A8H2ZVE8_9HELO|nr:460eccdf-58ac-4672-b086-95b556afbbb7-CDS [Sclerotinia trifoliorum]
MPRKDIEVKTHDDVTLCGWLYAPASVSEDQKLPVIIMSAGWASLKEMSLDQSADAFVAKHPVAALMSDMQNTITYAQGLPKIEAGKIAFWGSSYNGGHVSQVTATEKRMKAASMVSGWETLLRLIRPDLMPSINAMFAGNRLARAAGQAVATVSVSDANPLIPSSLPSAEAFAFYTELELKLEGKWKNESNSSES